MRQSANPPRERGLYELYGDDPERADALIFGRRTGPDRRGFLKGAGLAAVSTLLGATIPFHRNIPAGWIPAALAGETEGFVIPGKEGLRVLNDRPLNAETPPHLLDDPITPVERHFIRNNGIPPEDTSPEGWTLTVDGEVEKPLKLAIDDLRRNFEVVTYALQLECGGNGRGFFDPPAKGNQWTYGAVGCARWTGVRLRDVLQAAGLKPSAVYTGHYGADRHLSGDPNKIPISRGVPIEKALNPWNLIAFEMNGGPLHPMNGAPLRLVIPGWPGSCSQKWLTRIWVRDRVHDGPKMGGKSYRVPRYPVAPGEKVPKEDFVIIHSMPVKSLIPFPRTGIEHPADRPLEVRGHAWAGDNFVTRVDISIDFGRSWIRADLDPPENPYAWQNWRATVRFPIHGYYEIWARATDDEGRMQPFAIAWNPKGYLNNSMHRIAVRAVA
ncbi:MAG TPA: twin-arginine translocation signal domain-containing protein [Acidobacteria bacterium]|nr:twin-arginine translocation signal domain-containing protein [Acidobacteriota bacterium]